jgi:hypothetical protein
LIAIAYPDGRAVDHARDNLAEGVKEGLVDVEDAVVIVRDEDGTFDVRQGRTGVGGAAAAEAIRSGLIGVIFLAPLRRRGRDSNPRTTERPSTVFETASKPPQSRITTGISIPGECRGE